jgi:hypothetical protein
MKCSVRESWNTRFGFADRNVSRTSRSRINLKVISRVFYTFEFLEI